MAHLTESHRIKIEHYLNENYSYRKIAELLLFISLNYNPQLT